MDKKKEFDSFKETKNASDIFSFSEKENEKQFLNENFVYKFEDNKEQTGLDSNFTQEGQEDNDSDIDNHEHFEEHKIEKEDIDKFTQQSAAPGESSASVSSSSTTSASSTSSTAAVNPTVATVATVTTTAVIIVVGGGLVIGQTLEKPAVYQMVEVGAVDNNISFKLQIGNSEAESKLLSGGQECDIVVELLCPSDSNFVNNFEVKNYGEINGKFENLAYNTEYSVNVYQRNLLDISKQYLFDQAFSVTTGVNNNITISAEYDPFNNIRYYGAVKYNGDLSKYESVHLGIYDPNMMLDDEPMKEYMYVIEVDKSLDGRYELVCDDLPTYDQVYGIDLFGDVAPDATQGYDREVLLSTSVNFTKLTPSPFVVQNQPYFEYEYTADSNFYHVYIGADSATVSSYDMIQVNVYTKVETSDPLINPAYGPGDFVYGTSYREFNTSESFDINFGNYSQYDDYYVVVSVGNSQSPGGEQVEYWSGVINFTKIYAKPKPAVTFDGFFELTTYQQATRVTAARLNVFDPRVTLPQVFNFNVKYTDNTQPSPTQVEKDFFLSKDPYMSDYWQIENWEYIEASTELTLTITCELNGDPNYVLYTGITYYPEILDTVQYNGSVNLYSDYSQGQTTMVNVYVDQSSQFIDYINWRLVITSSNDPDFLYEASISAVNEEQNLGTALETYVPYLILTYATNPYDSTEFLIFEEMITLEN
jgi:hypothetical protein